MAHIIQLVFSDEKKSGYFNSFFKKKIEALPFHSYVAKRSQLVWLFFFFKEKIFKACCAFCLPVVNTCLSLSYF